jgi:8-oxo-dGTP diphosphatase
MDEDYITVVCGIILENSKILVAQRGPTMFLPGKWELPGGKRENNESDKECLVRELVEELGIRVHVGSFFDSEKHKYDFIKINLIAYFADIVGGNANPSEHLTVTWVEKEMLSKLDWAAADIPIIDKLINSDLI